ncbi:hypothetical protein ACRAWF_38245 [Streptomyces sp. L7]
MATLGMHRDFLMEFAALEKPSPETRLRGVREVRDGHTRRAAPGEAHAPEGSAAADHPHQRLLARRRPQGGVGRQLPTAEGASPRQGQRLGRQAPGLGERGHAGNRDPQRRRPGEGHGRAPGAGGRGALPALPGLGVPGRRCCAAWEWTRRSCRSSGWCRTKPPGGPAQVLPEQQYDVLLGLATGMEPAEIDREIVQAYTRAAPRSADSSEGTSSPPPWPVRAAGSPWSPGPRSCRRSWSGPSTPGGSSCTRASTGSRYQESYAGPARVTGGPGTGKTVVALHRAYDLARRLPADAPDGCVLLTTYTKGPRRGAGALPGTAGHRTRRCARRSGW